MKKIAIASAVLMFWWLALRPSAVGFVFALLFLVVFYSVTAWWIWVNRDVRGRR